MSLEFRAQSGIHVAKSKKCFVSFIHTLQPHGRITTLLLTILLIDWLPFKSDWVYPSPTKTLSTSKMKCQSIKLYCGRVSNFSFHPLIFAECGTNCLLLHSIYNISNHVVLFCS